MADFTAEKHFVWKIQKKTCLVMVTCTKLSQQDICKTVICKIASYIQTA